MAPEADGLALYLEIPTVLDRAGAEVAPDGEFPLAIHSRCNARALGRRVQFRDQSLERPADAPQCVSTLFM